MDESLARGLMRQHIRQSIQLTNRRRAQASAVNDSVGVRILLGKAITNPTTAMAGWRSTMRKMSAEVVQVAEYRRAAAFWPGWTPVCMDYSVTVNDGREVRSSSYENEEFVALSIMTDVLAVERKEATIGSTIAPLQVDRHALQRWLQRQPGAEIPAFEESVLQALPMVAVQHTMIDAVQASFGNAIPLGDGLLLGTMRNGIAEENFFGRWRQVKTSALVTEVPAVLVGTGYPHGRDVGGQLFWGQTYYGPRQLDNDLREVREALVAWQNRHADALRVMWCWLGQAALTNEAPKLPETLVSARAALMELMASDLWWRSIIERSGRSIVRSYASQQGRHRESVAAPNMGATYKSTDRR